MKKITISLALLVSLSTFANISVNTDSNAEGLDYTLFFENKGGIKGKIVAANGQPIEGAIIKTKDQTVLTDKQGNYTLTGLDDDSYELQISPDGVKQEFFIVNVSDGEVTIKNIVLSEETTGHLDEVVITASKIFAEKKSETVARMALDNLANSQVYTVVPKELLQEQVAVDFRSALLSSPGVSNVMLGVGSGGTGLAMMMRGFSGADGAGAIRNGMATNFVSLSDPSNLERLEVIKGPSATLFGSTLVSYGGLVNRVTKQPTITPKAAVEVTAGGYGLGRVAFDYNKPLNSDNTFLFRLNTAIHHEKSFQDQGVNKTFMFAPAFQYIVSDKLTVNVDMEYFKSDRNSTYVGLTPASKITNFDQLDWDFKRSYASDDITSKADVWNVFANAKYEIDEHWVSDTRFSYSNTDNDANYLFLLVKPGTGEYEGKNLLQRRLMSLPSNFNTMQVQQNFTGTHNWGTVGNKFLVGLDYTQLQTNDSRTMVNDYDAALGQVTVLNQKAPVINRNKYDALLADQTRASNHRDTQTFSIYASDVVTFFDRLNIMASLRFDRFHNRADDYQQSAWSPKFGVVYQIIKDELSIFGNYQNGFKNVAPSVLADNTKVTFKPEQANQFEGGFKFEFLDKKINGTLSYYHIKVKDKVRSVLNADNTLTSVQDGTQRSQGFEFDLIANPFKGFHVIVGYGYNDSKFQKSSQAKGQPSIEGNRPAGVPHNSANYWASYKFTEGALKGFGLGFGGNYSDSYYFNDANTVKINGFHTIDSSIYYEVAKFRVALKVNNITNKEYWTSQAWAIPQQTRTILGNVSFHF